MSIPGQLFGGARLTTRLLGHEITLALLLTPVWTYLVIYYPSIPSVILLPLLTFIFVGLYSEKGVINLRAVLASCGIKTKGELMAVWHQHRAKVFNVTVVVLLVCSDGRWALFRIISTSNNY